MSITVVLYLLAVIVFAAAIIDWPAARYRLLAFGLLLFSAAHVITSIGVHGS